MNKSAMFREYGVDILHHFGDREVIKETHIPAGVYLEQHEHDHGHLSVLVAGAVEVTVDGETKEYRGYHVIHVAAFKKHKVLALTNCVWLCMHGVAIVDRENVDKEILGG